MSGLHPDDPRWRRIDDALKLVSDEVSRAVSKFDTFNSPHEGYAVILEEVDELWVEIKANRGRHPAALDEATQVAAMAVRYIMDIGMFEVQP